MGRSAPPGDLRTHGRVLGRARCAQAWTFVREALAGDIADPQGGVRLRLRAGRPHITVSETG
ncbi:hypothetical protein [Streptomyces scabiei]|uniref:Uncharacterized protein n=1 Tax=Streptomyces scabiei TaxID=1930 RepID=A0A100JI73_STRSC|nr:hypothetical protein [Streptomyces scabiei]GAQ59970.1 hypothetical protein SsS58_00308 [Streptomyces scabiei]